MPKRKTTKRKSDYNPERLQYMSKDGKYYCYDITDEHGRLVRTQKIEITPELEEITFVLDDNDYRSDLTDRYEKALIDPELRARQARACADGEEGDLTGMIADPASRSTEDAGEVDPLIERVREIIETEFTAEQKELFFKHFGLGMQLEQIRQEEALKTGKLVVPSAMTGRVDRMLNKVAKALGAEPPKPRRK